MNELSGEREGDASGEGSVAGASTSSSTLATRIYERLRDDIIFGVLRPGERLKLEMLRERYDVGMTPLREALYRLSASMLVVIEDRRGVTVAPVSAEHLKDVLATREKLETLVLRSAFEQGDVVWEGRVIAAFHRLQRAARQRPNPGPYTPEWEDAHRSFHLELLAPAKVPMLREFHRIVWDHSARYRNLAYSDSDITEVFHGHEQLVDAVVQRDVELACILLQRHISLASTPLLQTMFPSAGGAARTAATRSRSSRMNSSRPSGEMS